MNAEYRMLNAEWQGAPSFEGAPSFAQRRVGDGDQGNRCHGRLVGPCASRSAVARALAASCQWHPGVRRLPSMLSTALTLAITAAAWGQTSSIGRRRADSIAQGPPKVVPRETAPRRGNPLLEKHSLIAVKPKPPKTYKINDHITIIVRQQRKFESDGDLESKRRYDIKSQLEAFFKPIQGGLGATTFARGKPNVDLKFSHRQKNEADTSREDRLTTRLTATIIDVKPNGNLVIWARARVQHDEEISAITLTGTCSKDKVTADNSVLSTDIADLDISIKNEGAIRDGTARGWLARLVDVIRPF